MAKVGEQETGDGRIGRNAREASADLELRHIVRIASSHGESNPAIAELLLKKGPAFLARVRSASSPPQEKDDPGKDEPGKDGPGKDGAEFLALEKVADLLTRIEDTNSALRNKLFAYSLDLIEGGGFSLLDFLADIIIRGGPYEHEKPFQALIKILPDIARRGGSEALNSIAVIGKNMSHVTWQIQHAVDFIRRIPSLIDWLNSLFDKTQVLKFFRMLERLSTNQYNFNNIVASLDHYLTALEKCKILGISDKALDLTDSLADADSIQSQNVFQFWIDFVESVFEVNTNADDGSPHPDVIRSEYRALLENLLEQITRESADHPITASYLIGYSGYIIQLIGYDGFDSILENYIRKIPTPPNQRAQVFLDVFKGSPDIIKALLTHGDKMFVMDIYGKAGALNKDMHVSECSALLKRTPQLVGKLGLEGLAGILELYSNILATRLDRTEADYDFIQFLNETPGIIDVLGRCGGRDTMVDLLRQAKRLAVYGPRLPHALLANAPEIWNVDGLTGIEKVTGIISTMAEKGTAPDGLLKVIPAIISHLGYEGIARSARIGRKIGRHHVHAATLFIENLPRHLSRLDYKGLTRLAEKIIETAIVDRHNSEALAKGETQEYIDFCDYISDGLHLKHIKPLLSYYLEALLGYRIEISPAPTADTDGKKIYLPKVIRDFKEDDKNLLMYKVQATHVEAHIEFGSFDFQISKVSDLVDRLTEAFSPTIVPDGRRSDEQVFFALFPEPKLIQELKDILEDFRIETRLAALYPVLGKDTLRMNRHRLKVRPSLETLESDKERAVEVLGQMLSAKRSKETIPDAIAPLVEDALSASASLKSPGTDIHDTFRVAAEIYRYLQERFPDTYRETAPFSAPINQADFDENIGNFSRTAERISDRLSDGDDAPPEEDGSDPPEDSTASKDDPDYSLSDKRDDHPMGYQEEQDGAGYDHDGQQPSDRELPTDELRELLLQLFKDKNIKPKEIARDIEALDPEEILDYLKNLDLAKEKEKEKTLSSTHFQYPEWGNDINAYRAAWTTVIERNVEEDDPDFYRETLREYGGLIKRIRREFQVLRPEALTKLRRQFDGNHIDFDAAIDYQIDLRLNIAPSEKNYIQTLKRDRDIAVAFLIDLSGSTSGKTIRCEKQSLIMLSEALNELRDTFAIYGFTGYTKESVDFYSVKAFSEIYDQKIKQRISGLTPGSNTREGAAIRHALSKLKVREERTKILILLNDSQPFDEGYQGDYAIADTRMALSEAKKLGIRPFCLTITKNHRHLRELYSSNSWVVINDITTLPEKITRIYQRLTT